MLSILSNIDNLLKKLKEKNYRTLINYRLVIYNKTCDGEYVQYLITAILTGAMQVTVFMIEIRLYST